jgi:hypothetical protein
MRPRKSGTSFDGRRRRAATHGADHVDEMLRAAVAQVVAVDAGDHHVAQLEPGNAVGQIRRLVDIGRQRLAMADVAERAAARTDVAENHEGRRAAAEAFADIRASGFFADGVQLLLAQHFLDLAEATRVIAGLDANPVRLALWRLRDDLDRNARRLQLAPLLDPGDPGGRSCLRRSPGPDPDCSSLPALQLYCQMSASAVAACDGVSEMPRSRVWVTGRPG